MGKLTVFNHVTVDGFFAGPHGETDWFKAIEQDEEWDAYTHEGAGSGNTLVFGRTTYDMMKSYWPTPAAAANDPAMTRVMRTSPKIVFSKTLQTEAESPDWKNITLLREVDPRAIRQLKSREGDFTILGSGSIVQQVAKLGLIDEYLLATVPIVLGAGKTMFKDVKVAGLKLLEARAFKNGIVLLHYSPAA
jgi:dihydrofolate reductase